MVDRHFLLEEAATDNEFTLLGVSSSRPSFERLAMVLPVMTLFNLTRAPGFSSKVKQKAVENTQGAARLSERAHGSELSFRSIDYLT